MAPTVTFSDSRLLSYMFINPSTASGLSFRLNSATNSGIGVILYEVSGANTDLGSITTVTGVNSITTDTADELSLISPIIDLTSVAAAGLSFARAVDLDTNDSAVVRVFNADTDEEIVVGVFPLTISDDDLSAALWETSGPFALPVGALIRIEWILSGTGGDNEDFMGWYIDDVVVTETTP